MSASEIDRTLMRLTHEILERNNGAGNLVFVGIRRRGIQIAERLALKIAAIENTAPPVGALDVTSYRDDLSSSAAELEAVRPEFPFSVADKTVILVDDVLYTGRTIRAALDALVDIGRAPRVELCVLIDRGYRELPIQADYVGRVVQTTELELVEVRLPEVDGEEKVLICERKA